MNGTVKNILEVKGISKQFNGQKVLDKVSFSLPAGTCLAIVGDNGSGKTTLFNILSGLIASDEGSVKFAFIAKPLAGRSFQYARNFGTLNVADNLLMTGGREWREELINGLFFLRKVRQAEEQILEEAAAIAEEWGIDLKNLLQSGSRLDDLSLGQQRLVELIRLFLSGSQVFLMDEPTVHLSKDACARLGAFMKHLLTQGKSFIIISHDHDFLRAYANQVLHLEKGSITYRGDSSRVKTPDGQKDLPLFVPPSQENEKENMLELSHLAAGYGDKMICRDISLQIGKGEILTVTGENGCGKSTLIKTVFGSCPVISGLIRFNNEIVNDLSPEQRVKKGISYVFQDKRIFSRMTVEENLHVAFPGPKKARSEKLREIYDLFPVLERKEKVSGGLLSGGEQQMLAIGRVLMQSPRLILLDEPFSGLTETFTEILLDQVKYLSKKGTSFLIIEHRIEKAQKISDRLLILENGKII